MAVAGLCEHNAWLHLTGKVGETIRYGQRYSRIIQEMTNPSAQFPSLTFFMGRKRKEAALRVIFPHNNTPKKQQVTDTVKLRIDNATLNAEHPLLFADCDLNQIKLQSDDCYHLCHPDQRLPFTSAASAAHPPFDILLTRLFFLFTDVICIFAEDLGGLENVQKSLMRWATVGSASTLPANVRPRVLIVTHNDEPGVANALFEEEDFCYNVPQGSGIGMGQTFASIRTLKLPGRYLSPLAQYQRLREEILRETDISREDRIATFSLFSAVHQNAFFEKALLHTLRTIREPFNFVQAAHHRDLAAADIRHLTNFLELCIQKRLSYDAVTSVLATSILMDAFPPGKPPFCPKTVFDTLYRPSCLDALRKSYNDSILVGSLIQRLEDNLVSMYALVAAGQSPSQVHRSNLASHREQLVHIKSNLTCLVCLLCSPEHPMACGHSLCDICVQRFGDGMIGFENRFIIHACVICLRQSALVADLKPPTAGVRIVSIDGGGTRGIIPLKTLLELQDLVGADCPIQEFFDLAVGTSAGGLIVLGLFVRQWGIDRCINSFRTMTKKFFGHGRGHEKSFTHSVQRLWKCWRSDSVHDVQAVEDVLIESFGRTTRMFGYSQLLPSRFKVAVTAATAVGEPSLVVFSNYNGICPQDYGYSRVRPRNTEHEPFVWQAGRATSAAPMLFRTAKISPFGTFQDGAMSGHNNPIYLALWESRHIWPSIKPDVVVSLGTGMDTPPAPTQSPLALYARKLSPDGCFRRIYSWAVAGVKGQEIWKKFFNQLEDHARADHFRLNIEFPDAEPAIDDVDCMEYLSNCVHVQPQASYQRQETVSALLVSSLFFELDELPAYASGAYLCQGSIRCRINSHALIRVLLRTLGPDLQYFKDFEFLGCKVSEQDIYLSCDRYVRHVRFRVTSLDDAINLSLKWREGERRLSGMPQTLSWFIDQQNLRSPFGFSTNGNAGTVQCHACRPVTSTFQLGPSKASRKRSGTFLPTTPNKRAFTHKQATVPRAPLQGLHSHTYLSRNVSRTG